MTEFDTGPKAKGFLEVPDRLYDRDPHYHCDRDITRLGRENDELKEQLAALNTERGRSDGLSRMNHAQRNALWDKCAGYNVPFREDDYHPQSDLPPGYYAGWIGGWEGIGHRRTIFVGVSPEGELSS
jgi:hypothetical protein